MTKQTMYRYTYLEKAMVIGILESSSERFISDVVSRLDGIPVEFISLADENIPLERKYGVIIDRMSFRYPFLREIMKGLALDGTYIINNPFTASSTNKLVEIRLGSSLGINFPKTIVLPDQSSIGETEGVVSQPSLERIVEEIGLPCVLKPFDGYAWEDVHVISSKEELRQIYSSLHSLRVLIAQRLIRFKEYFRAFCFGKKDVLFIKWIPKPLAMGQYLYTAPGILGDVEKSLTELTIHLNKVLDLDVNVVEWCVDEQGKWWVIDAFNEVPEIIPEALPTDYYAWIVERFAACVMDKLNHSERNRIPFD